MRNINVSQGVASLLLLALAGSNFRSSEPAFAQSEEPPVASSLRVHHTGYLKVQVGNQGLFSAQTGYPAEACHPETSTGLGFVNRGGIWFGGITGKDTLVSVVLDPDYPLQEFTPAPFPDGDFVERTRLDSLKRPSGYVCPSLLHDPLGRSDQDLTVTYTDTVVDGERLGSDPTDGRPHLPLGIMVHQTSYSWSHGYGADITIFDYQFTNIGSEPIHHAYVGVFVDHDIGSFDDDWTGFIDDVPAREGDDFRDTLGLAWCSDNDGDPEAGRYSSASPTRALGFRFLRTPARASGTAFNWWINAGQDYGWGPALRRNTFQYCDFCPFPGVPFGDEGKYRVMSNGEVDYDQTTSALDHSLDGWLPPQSKPGLATDVADGFDGRFLLSTGPFELKPGASESLTLAMVTGRDLHVDPDAFGKYWDPGRPQYLMSRLDFDGLVSAARWAGYLFDTPGFDTDGDGYAGKYRVVAGDTTYYEGDGIPDFMDPPPPPAPVVRIKRSGTTLSIRWNGEGSETSRDPYLQRPDFEGYRVYLNSTGGASDFALLSQRDLVDYLRYEWNAGALRWQLRDTPFTLDSLQSLYGPLSVQLGFPFHPDSFSVPEPSRALCVVLQDPYDPNASDTACYYFAPFGGNLTADDAALVAADSAGFPTTAVIHKVYPHADPSEVRYDRSEPYRPFFEYEFSLSGIYLADPLYVAVTAFDFGNPQFDLAPQEDAPAANRQFVYPGFDKDASSDVRPKPGVYPNPYRLIDDYAGHGWENPQGTETDPERARRITFFNLPPECTISIWTLDGDLVKEIHHQVSGASGPDFEIWNVITRNGEKVRTGLYIWSIESLYGNDVGKLAVIR